MTADQNRDLALVLTACNNLIENNRTLMLSTYSEKNQAEISYAPFVREDFRFYVFVSELAQHTRNMLTTLQASVMFIQDEAKALDPFARERLIFNCSVCDIAREDIDFLRQLDVMQNRQGETVKMLRTLNDFHLLQLLPVSGRYIGGFGKAYSIEVENNRLRLKTARLG